MTDLTVRVEVSAGSDIRSALEEMCVLASRLGCVVRAEMNQVHMMVKPGSDPREAYALWEDEVDSKRPYKVACAQPVEIPRDKPWDRPRLDLGKNDG